LGGVFFFNNRLAIILRGVKYIFIDLWGFFLLFLSTFFLLRLSGLGGRLGWFLVFFGLKIYQI
ncbi:hypothetical protein ACVGW2_01330, partial [Enterobacter intestinihominis]